MPETDIFFLEGTEKTPQFDFNNLNGELILSGRSIPENASKIYEPVLAWVNEYVKSPNKKTNLRLNLEYFNSASLIWISRIVRSLSMISLPDSLFMIHLYFDSEDFNTMDVDELKDIVVSLVGNIGRVKVSIGIKLYGINHKSKIIRESMIFV